MQLVARLSRRRADAVGVALFGEVVNGSRRWLHVGVTRIQPSEVKIMVPMMLAWYFQSTKCPALAVLSAGAVITIILVVHPQTARPGHRHADHGLGLLCCFGWSAVEGDGHWLAVCRQPAVCVWNMMHDYQRKRVLTLIDPSSGPTGHRLPHHPVDDRHRLRRP